LVEHWTFNPGVQGSNPCGIVFLFLFVLILFMDIDTNLKQILESNPLAFTTTNNVGRPHIIYVMYAKVIDTNKLLITDNYMEKTKKNIFENKNVALSVLAGNTAFELIGTAEYLSGGKMVEKIKALPENKGFPCKGAIIVNVENVVKMG
jgi:predicted pyridoxine 5'-phosphate oxidase superfamily flavin-nucleotide-binding protein